MKPDAACAGMPGLVRDALERGDELVITVSGESMLPTLRPGTQVRIRHATPDRLRPGQLAVYRDGPRLVLHRFIGHTNAKTLLFLGDRCRGPLERIPQDQLLGVVTAVRLAGRQRPTCGWCWRAYSRTLRLLGRAGLRLPAALRRPLWQALQPLLRANQTPRSPHSSASPQAVLTATEPPPDSPGQAGPARPLG